MLLLRSDIASVDIMSSTQQHPPLHLQTAELAQRDRPCRHQRLGMVEVGAGEGATLINEAEQELGDKGQDILCLLTAGPGLTAY